MVTADGRVTVGSGGVEVRRRGRLSNLPPSVRAVIEARPPGPQDHQPWPQMRQGRPVLVVCGGAVDVWTLLWVAVTRGPVPEGHRVVSCCGRQGCVRPAHLKARPTAQWAVRQRLTRRRARPSVCAKGHDLLLAANVFWSSGRRRCRVCKRARERARVDALGNTHPRHRRGPDGRYRVCRRGHWLAGSNVIVEKSGARRCRICRLKAARRLRARKKAH